MASLSSSGVFSSTDRGYTSDSELQSQQQQHHSNQSQFHLSSQTMTSAVSDQSLNAKPSPPELKQIDASSTSTTHASISNQTMTNSANQYKIDLDDEGKRRNKLFKN